MHCIHMSIQADHKSATNTAGVLTATKTCFVTQLNYAAHYEAALKSEAPF